MAERDIEISNAGKFMKARFEDSRGRATLIFSGLHTLARQVEVRKNGRKVVFHQDVAEDVEAEFNGSMLFHKDNIANSGIKFPKREE